MNENHESPLSPEEELALAQERVAEAKRKLDALEQLRIQRLRQELADKAADEERRRFQQAEEQKLIEQRWLEKKRCEDEQCEAERRAKEAAQRELEHALAQAQEEQHQRQQHEKEIQRLADEAYLLEQEAKRREAELYANTPVVEAAADSVPATSGRDLLFARLTKQATRFDGCDGHAEEPSNGGAETMKTKTDSVTAFERECERLGLTTPQEMIQSKALRIWVENNFETRFVPEQLLTEYGLPTPEQFV
jgi:hypothetical protein